MTPNPLAEFVRRLQAEQVDFKKESEFAARVDEAIEPSSSQEIEISTEDIEPMELPCAQRAKNISKQLCRQWLKHEVLHLGSPCAEGDMCPRLHDLSFVKGPGQLFSDYSFKGLSKQQR